jgi:hypothetical protein
MQVRGDHRVWITANAVGVSLGITISLTVFMAIASESPVALAWATWGIAGACVAAAQTHALPLARLHRARWLLGGALAPMFGIPVGIGLGFYAIVALPWSGMVQLHPALSDVVTACFGAIPGGLAGLCTGFTVGAFQAPAIPAGTGLRNSWVLSNSAAWFAAGALFGGLVMISGVAFPLSPTIIMDWIAWLVSLAVFGALSGGIGAVISQSQYLWILRLEESVSRDQ